MNRRRSLVLGACAWGGLLAMPSRAGAASPDAQPLTGKPAPAFEVPDTKGRKRQLAEFKGKLIVLEWSSPSCPFVRAQYQSGVMQELQRWATSQGMVWLTVLSAHPTRRDYLAPEKAEAFNRDRGAVSTALLLDSEGTMGRAYGAAVTPHMFIIDASGNLAYAGAPTDNATMDAKQVKTSRNLVRAALEDLAAGRKIRTPYGRPFGCAIAYSSR